MRKDEKAGYKVLNYISAFIYLLLITSIVQSASDDPFMSKPQITSGTEITEGDSITVSSNFNGNFSMFQGDIIKSSLSSFVLNYTYDLELYENNRFGRDVKLAEASYSHINRFSKTKKSFSLLNIGSLRDLLTYILDTSGQATVELTERGHSQSVNDIDTLNNIMRNLVDAPIGMLSTDKDIFVRIRARVQLNDGIQKDTDWSRSDTMALNVVEKPYPAITYTVSSESITLGESITIRAEGRNVGGKANEYSTLSVSFPDLNGRDDARQVSLGNNNFYDPRYYTQIISPGDRIFMFNNGGIPTMKEKESTAQYVVVEGGSSEGVNWDAGETHFMDLQVTPNDVGEFDIYLRMTLTSLTDAADFRQMFTDPVYSDQKDQQNFLVYHKTITVKEKPPELVVEPSGYYIDFGNVDKGETFSKKVRISSRDQAGDTEVLSWSIEEKKTLNDGGKEGISWASFSPSSGSLNKGRSADLDIEIDTNNEEIKQGHRYDATFHINSNGGGSGHQIKFYVNKPELNTDPIELDFGEIFAGKAETRELRISNSGEGKLKWEVDQAGMPSWIKLDRYSGKINAGDTATKVTVTVDTASLTPNDMIYFAGIPITSNGANKEVFVSLKVLKPPELSVGQYLNRDFELEEGEKRSWTISIDNYGSGNLNWTAKSDCSWLSLDPERGSTTIDRSFINVKLDSSGLKPGRHAGHITIDSNGGSEIGTVSINIPASPEPKLCTAPEDISHDFGSIPEGEARSWDIEIINCGNDVLDWSISSDQHWLRVTPSFGTTTAPLPFGEVIVTVDTQDLKPGKYEGRISIESSGGSETGTIKLEVPSDEPSPTRSKLCTDPDDLYHDFATVPKDQTRSWDFEVSNCGSGTLTWSTISDEASSAWLKTSPASGSTTSEYDTVTVTVDTHGLEPGAYEGLITLDSNEGKKTSQITVTVPSKPDTPKSITVCPSGCDHSSIQEAIGAASPGDIVEVQSGTYRESLHVDKQITIRSVDTGDGEPILEASSEGCAVEFSADGASIEGLILKTITHNPEPLVISAITVGPGDCDYTSIQEAIDATKPGDVIEVYSGTYYENVVVNKKLTLRGVDIGGGIPVVDGRNGEIGIALLSDGINLENFNVINSVTGIKIGSSKISVRDNTVHDNTCGIYIEYSDNYIANNHIHSNLVGVTVPQSCNDIITNNDIVDNSMKVVYLEN